MKAFLITYVILNALGAILHTVVLCIGRYPLQRDRSDTAIQLIFTIGFLCWAVALLFGSGK